MGSIVTVYWDHQLIDLTANQELIRVAKSRRLGLHFFYIKNDLSTLNDELNFKNVKRQIALLCREKVWCRRFGCAENKSSWQIPVESRHQYDLRHNVGHHWKASCFNLSWLLCFIDSTLLYLCSHIMGILAIEPNRSTQIYPKRSISSWPFLPKSLLVYK